MRRPLVPVLALVVGAGAGFGASSARAQHPATPLVYEWELPRCGASATQMAHLIQDCMTRVMHPRGIEGGEKAEVDVHTAATLCRRTRSFDNSRALASCVRALMYERSGLGSRREEVSSDTATIACRYATSTHQVEQVEDCMKRLLYTRSGLGHGRTEMTPTSAAYACQGVAAPLAPWPFQPVCRPPAGEEATRFIEDCVKRLLYTRDGLGHRRTEVTPEAAAIACEGALSWYP